MKTRDMIGITFAVVILVCAGILLYTQLAPASKDSGIQVVVPQKVTVPLSEETDRTKLSDIKKLQDLSDPQKCDDDIAKCTRVGGASPF